jgi:hypothetical protein
MRGNQVFSVQVAGGATHPVMGVAFGQWFAWTAIASQADVESASTTIGQCRQIIHLPSGYRVSTDEIKTKAQAQAWVDMAEGLPCDWSKTTLDEIACGVDRKVLNDLRDYTGEVKVSAVKSALEKILARKEWAGAQVLRYFAGGMRTVEVRLGSASLYLNADKLEAV